MIGRTLRHYRMEAKLGEGGMGVVYRALDTHLDRPVAIKVLPPEALADPERKRRFVQEAKAASALNHPNIITIHDVDHADGVDFIVMEYVPGRTLDQVIGRKGVRVGDALRYATQVADALARAHGAGIVHRDLKPGNIMVTPEDLVKVLDFGLAKLIERETEADNLMATRTLAADAQGRTEAGTIVGTVAYMSPEQAEGRRVDARSDIFSFGLLLYEMISGRRAFQGETKLSTLAAIMNLEPKPLAEAAEGVPRDLEKIIVRCLRKDLRRRFQHMDDVLVALEEVKEESGSARVAPPAPPPRRVPATALWGLAVLVSLAAGWWLGRGRRPEATRPALLTRLTSDPGLSTDPALAPNADLVAYASDRSGEGSLDIWVQQISGGEPIRRTTDPADDSEPSFSPDGGRIAFRSERQGGGVYVMPALGGEERLVVKEGRGPRFSPDGKWIAYWAGIGGRYESTFPRAYQMYVMPAAGGAPRQLVPEFATARYPVWSPDGRRLLLQGRRNASGPLDWWVVPAEGGSVTQTFASAVFEGQKLDPYAGPGAWFGDAIFFAARLGSARSVWKVSLASPTWRIQETPMRLTFGTGLEGEPSIAGKRLVFPSLAENTDVWSLPLDANQAKVTGPLERLTDNMAAEVGAAVSPDGKRLVFVSDRNGNLDLWSRDLATGKESLLAPKLGQGWATLSPDGSRVAYVAMEGGKASTYAVAIGSRDLGQKLCDDCGFPTEWLPDGTGILTMSFQQPRTIGLLNLPTRQHQEWLRRAGYSLYQAAVSPDGRWIAQVARIGSAQFQVFVLPYPQGRAPAEADWIPIEDAAGIASSVAWSPDGNILYFLSDRHGYFCLWARRFDRTVGRPQGPAFPVYDLHSARRSISNLPPPHIHLSLARNRMVFSQGEVLGNIWTMDLPGGP